MTSEFPHQSVLLTESITALQPAPGHRYIDATLGLAGHAERLLELSSPTGLLLGIDADPTAISTASGRLARFAPRFQLVESYFDRIAEIARERDFRPVHGIIFDLGVSSPQLDEGQRGFSFREDAPLDMRFGRLAPSTAADLIASLPRAELETIFREYGEERFAGRIARAVVETRASGPIRTTGSLADLVTRAKPRGVRESIHPATRVFQALRIAVNDELGRLDRALPAALDLLAEGGRLAVISFHSLEDRIVKRLFQRESRDCICPPQVPVCVCGHRATIRVLTRKPIEATEGEVAANPRARSARLRVAERLAA